METIRFLLSKIEVNILFFMLMLWPVISFSSSLMLIFFWLSFSLWLLMHILKRQMPELPDRTTVILLTVFFGAVLVSLTVTDHPQQSFRGIFKILRQVAVFLLAFFYFRALPNQLKLRAVIFFSFLLLLVDGAYQFIFKTDFLRGFEAQGASSGLRLSASFEHYGKLAAYLCAVLPVIIGYALSAFRKGWQRYEFWVWLLLACAGGWLLFMTRSRGAFVAFFAAWTAVLILRRSWKILGLMCLAGAVFVAVLPKSMIIHLDAENKEQSLVERLELWHRAWDVIQARPLTGTGINTYAVAHQEYDTRQNWRVRDYYAHNGYLQTAAEIGIPGTLALVLLLLRWLWKHRPGWKDCSSETEIRWGFFAGTLTFMIFCAGDTAMHSLQPVMAFWYVAGCLGALSLTKPAES